MKLTVFTFLFSLSFIISAQPYKPMLDNFNEWRLTNCFQGNCSDEIYYTDGDTLHGGYQYKVLDGFHFISRTLWLREDSVNQKVYLSYKDVTSPAGFRIEDLLYDFSLQIGDSIFMKNPISPFTTDAGYFTLDSINMEQLLDGNNYRHYYLSPSLSNIVSTNTAEWIEGVGSLSLVNAPSGFPDVNGVGKVSCCFKNGTLFYSNLDSTTGCVSSTVSNFNQDPVLNELKVYPTFVENKCHITGMQDMRNIAVYNVNGKLIQQKPVLNTNQLDLNLDKLISGIYFLVLSDGKNDQFPFKIIKK